MRLDLRPVPLAALLLLAAAPAHARRVDIEIGACRDMYELMVAMHAGAPHDSVQAALDSVLDSPSYRVMFRHYNRSWRPNHLPPKVFERMILSLEFPDEYKAGENGRADSMLPRWRAAYDDLPRYRRQLGRLETARLPALVDRGVRYAQSWLPPGWTIPDFALIVLPQGGSPAFSIDGSQGYDFFQIPSTASGDLDVSWLVGTIAHESNHLGMRARALPVASASDSVAFALVNLCVAEGVATEFISGPPAGLAPAVPGVPFHVFTPDLVAAWNARVAEEPRIVERMAELLDRAVRGALSPDQLQTEIGEYWFEGTIGRGYVLGSEMFGAIDLGLGKKAVFAAIEDPRRLFQLYDQALDKRPDLLGRCVRMPARAVEQALAIGTAR